MKRVPRRVLIVDGYNVLNARRAVTGAEQLADARERLVADLQNYAGYTAQQVTVVFDAWLSDRAERSEEDRGPVRVVYTRKGETADRYIEHICDEYAPKVEMREMELRVATSDQLEQTIVLGRGAVRLSSRELLREMGEVSAEGARRTGAGRTRITVEDRIPRETLERLRRLSRGED
ncbi:MAG: NYN domain-containing protein [Clostridia bacterium]|nr:NYN domain-containing protein [Clostridia bacterium]